MYWYLVKTSHDQYNGGGCCVGTTVLVLCIGIALRLPMTYYWYGCGGGTTVLILCIGIESRHHKMNSAVVFVVVPLYWYYVLVLSQGFRLNILLWWWYHGIGIMYLYLVQTLDINISGGGFGGGTTVLVLCIGIESRLQMTYNCGGYGGGTTVLVLCFGNESRPQMTNSVVLVLVVVPLYWYYDWYLVQTFHNQFSGGGFGGGTTVLVLGIGIESRLQITNTMVVVPLYYVSVLSPDFRSNTIVVVVPLYWFYVLVLVLAFSGGRCGGSTTVLVFSQGFR